MDACTAAMGSSVRSFSKAVVRLAAASALAPAPLSSNNAQKSVLAKASKDAREVSRTSISSAACNKRASSVRTSCGKVALPSPLMSKRSTAGSFACNCVRLRPSWSSPCVPPSIRNCFLSLSVRSKALLKDSCNL